MPRARSRTYGHRPLRTSLTAALLLVLGLLVAGFGGASAGASTQVQPSLVVTAGTDNSALAGAPADAVPGVLAAKNTTPITITISLSDGTDLTKGLVLDLGAVYANGKAGLGTFSPSSFTVPSKGPGFTFTVTYSAADDAIALRAAPHKASNTSPLPGRSAFFDVLETLKLTPQGDPSLQTGLGADSCNTQSTVSVCGVVFLAHGIGSPAAALSSGVCSDAGCSGGKEVQFIAGLKDQTGADIYSREDPATLILQCDKARCKGKGVSSYHAFASLSATGALTEVPACVTKGVIQDGADFCTDYVSSHRDNAGDLLLHVLFFKDMRGTM